LETPPAFDGIVQHGNIYKHACRSFPLKLGYVWTSELAGILAISNKNFSYGTADLDQEQQQEHEEGRGGGSAAKRRRITSSVGSHYSACAVLANIQFTFGQHPSVQFRPTSKCAFSVAVHACRGIRLNQIYDFHQPNPDHHQPNPDHHQPHQMPATQAAPACTNTTSNIRTGAISTIIIDTGNTSSTRMHSNNSSYTLMLMLMLMLMLIAAENNSANLLASSTIKTKWV
jgi:hypothetical protein